MQRCAETVVEKQEKFVRLCMLQNTSWMILEDLFKAFYAWILSAAVMSFKFPQKKYKKGCSVVCFQKLRETK